MNLKNFKLFPAVLSEILIKIMKASQISSICIVFQFEKKQKIIMLVFFSSLPFFFAFFFNGVDGAARADAKSLSSWIKQVAAAKRPYPNTKLFKMCA